MFAKKNCQFLLLLTGSALIMAVPLPDSCELPNCRRPGSSIPGSLKPNEVPQMVVMNFEDDITTENLKYINQLFGEKYRNPNGCPMQYTFFASDIENEYNVSIQLASKGHEIASLIHSPRPNISAEDYKKEIVGMRTELSLSGVKVSGVRTPFPESGGDARYKVLKENGFVWDSSMLLHSPHRFNGLPLWPFTLDEPVSEKYCVYSRCPKGSYPGLWEFRLHRFYFNQEPNSPKGILDALRDNFNNYYYQKNRAPFVLYLRTYILKWSSALEMVQSFLEWVATHDDVYVVTVSQAIDWVKSPTPLSQISNLTSWNCTQ